MRKSFNWGILIDAICQLFLFLSLCRNKLMSMYSLNPNWIEVERHSWLIPNIGLFPNIELFLNVIPHQLIFWRPVASHSTFFFWFPSDMIWITYQSFLFIFCNQLIWFPMKQVLNIIPHPLPFSRPVGSHSILIFLWFPKDFNFHFNNLSMISILFLY